MEFKHLILNKEDNIGVLRINRPEAMNSLNTEVLKELLAAVEQVKNDEDIYVLILTGEGKAFVAGADISEMSTMDSVQARSFAETGLKAFREMEIMEKPVIAAVNGFALGGGCELAMACDIRVASTKAKFGQPEVGLGVTPGFGGTVRLSRHVGLAKAKELIYTGSIIKADEALQIGLVNRVAEPEDLMGTAMEMAKMIASNAQLAVRYSKQSINRSFETDMETGMEIERNLFGLCFSTEDQKEGMKAFGEKRRPEFKVK
ncbi:short-chain-enoyl-CoA hydratase [Gudongella sp. SC589]|uniref:short-chain-enoyl-CoA hydratase n=1 Tax=Gudongella sp. SC589 TaxID=3385990 RepID=UPI003904AE2E